MAVQAVKQDHRPVRLQFQVLMTALLWQAAGCDIFYGKLVVKSKSLEQNRGQIKFDKILADKVATHISKQGDVFHVHQPGLDASAGMGSVSFESARLPGYYLLQAAQADSYNLRLEKIKPRDEKFAKQATYLVNPGAGIDGADTFELVDKPGWYICLQSHHLRQSALNALKDDGSQETLGKCSFFIQDIPLQYLSNEVNLSRIAAEEFAYQPTETIKSLLDEYFRTKEAMLEDYAKKSRAASVQKAATMDDEQHRASIAWPEGQLQPDQVQSNAWNQGHVQSHWTQTNLARSRPRSRQHQNAVKPTSESYAQPARLQPLSYEYNPSGYSVEQASEVTTSFQIPKLVVTWPSEMPSNVDKRGPYISSRLLGTRNRFPTLTKINSSLNPQHPEQLKERTFQNRLHHAFLKAGRLAMSAEVPSIRSSSYAPRARQVSSPKDQFLPAGSLLSAATKRKEGIAARKSSDRLWPTILASTRRNTFKQSSSALVSSHRWEFPSELLKKNPRSKPRQMENSMERNRLPKVQGTDSGDIGEKAGHLIGVIDAGKPVSEEEEAKYLLFFTTNNPTTDKNEFSSAVPLHDSTTERNDKIDDIFGGAFQGDDKIQSNDSAPVMPYLNVSNSSGETGRMHPAVEWHPESLTSLESVFLDPSSTNNKNSSPLESADQEYERGHRKFIVISHSSKHPHNKTQRAIQYHPRDTLGDMANVISSSWKESENASLIDEDRKIQEQRRNNQAEFVSTAKGDVPVVLKNVSSFKLDPHIRGNETMVTSEDILSDHNINSSYITLGEPKYHTLRSSDRSVEPAESERDDVHVKHEDQSHRSIFNKSTPKVALLVPEQQALSSIKSTKRIGFHPIDSDHNQSAPEEENSMLSTKLGHSGNVSPSGDGLNHAQKGTNKYVGISTRLSSSNDQASWSDSGNAQDRMDLEHDILQYENNQKNTSQDGDNDDIHLQSLQAKVINPPPYLNASGPETASDTKPINSNSFIVRDDQFKDGRVTKKDTYKTSDQKSEAGSQNRSNLEFEIELNQDFIRGGDSQDDEEDSISNFSKDFLKTNPANQLKPSHDNHHEPIIEYQSETLNDSKKLGSTRARQGNLKNYANQTDIAFKDTSKAGDGKNTFSNLLSNSTLEYHDLSLNSSTNATYLKQNDIASVKEPDFYVTASGNTFLRDGSEPQSVPLAQEEIPSTSYKNHSTYAPTHGDVLQSKHDNSMPINISREHVDFVQMASKPNQITIESMSNNDVKETSSNSATGSKIEESRNELNAKSDDWDDDESEVGLNQHAPLPPSNVNESSSPSPAFPQATSMLTNSQDDNMDEEPNELTNKTFTKPTSGLPDFQSSQAPITQATSMLTNSEYDDVDEESSELTNKTFSKATSGLADFQSSKAPITQATSMAANSEDDDVDEEPSELTNKTFSKATSGLADLRENPTYRFESGEDITREEGIRVLQAIATYLQGHNETKPVDASMDADRESLTPSISDGKSQQESWQTWMREPNSLHENNTSADSNKSASSSGQQLQEATDVLPAIENIEQNARHAQKDIPSDTDEEESPTNQVLDEKNK